MKKSAPIVLFTGVQRLARRIRSLGYTSACLVAHDEEPTAPHEIDHWLPFRPGDLMALHEMIQRWSAGRQVVGIINRRERRTLEHAVLNRALDRPGIDLHQARILRDKLMMRRVLQEVAPHLNPPFQAVDLHRREPPSIPYPLVIKPRAFFKSQLIELCETPEDWDRIRTRLLGRVADTERRHGVRIETRFLAETYLQGHEISIDLFVDRDGRILWTPVVDLVPARLWGIRDFHVAARYLPSSCNGSEKEAVQEAVMALVRALEIQASPLHADLVLVQERPLLLEMAPRLGGYRSEMMELAHGCSLDELNLSLAVGKGLAWRPQKNRAVAVVEIFPPRSGRLAAISGREDLTWLPSFHRMRQRVQEGQQVGLAREGFRCVLFAILVHDDPKQVHEDVETLRDSIRIQVIPDGEAS